jgi:hypothetical protein
MHIMYDLVYCKLYVAISIFIVFVNLSMCLYVICNKFMTVYELVCEL